MSPLTRLLVAALLILGTAVPLAAQPGAWVRLDGPEAARLVATGVSGNGTPFTVSDLVIHRYDLGDETWGDITDTFTGSFLDVAGGPGGEAWAGTGGVFHVLANGTWDWFPVRTGTEGLPLGVERVAVGPNGTVYVTGLFVNTEGGVQEGGFRSTNNGQSWPEMTVAPAAMAFVGTTAYAGTLDGVFVSTNSGGTWVRAGLDGQAVQSLTASGTRLAAATADGLWTSPDGGATWTPAASLGGVATLAASDGGVVWAATPGGLHRSTDGGASWLPTPTFFVGETLQDVDASGLTVLALVERTPFLSLDGGQTWSETNTGIGLRNAQDAMSAGGVLAVVVNGAGPFRSTDGGQTWALWNEGLATLTGRQFATDAAAGWAVLSTHDALYRTALDGSGPWTPLAFPGDRPIGIASDAGLLVASVSTPSPSTEGRLLRSTDGGLTWTIAYEEPGRFVGLPAAGGGVVALPLGSFTSPRLLVSADGGQMWLDRPHPTAEPFSAMPPAFVDGTGRIYVGELTSSRLRRSTDLGATWTTLGPLGGSNVRALSLLVEPGLLCAGASGGVFCSTDDGATFAPANGGLPTSEEGGRDVIDLFRDGSRYVALMDDEGLFVSAAATATEPSETPGSVFALSAPTPNPATGRVALTLTVPTSQAVRVEAFDALGRRVAVLHDGALTAGAHVLAFDASRWAPGVYVVRVLGDGRGVATRRLAVAR